MHPLWRTSHWLQKNITMQALTPEQEQAVAKAMTIAVLTTTKALGRELKKKEIPSIKAQTLKNLQGEGLDVMVAEYDRLTKYSIASKYKKPKAPKKKR